MFGNGIGTQITRREVLRRTGALAGACALSQFVPAGVAGAASEPMQQGIAPAEALAAARARFGSLPIESTPIVDNLTLLIGPGGNVVVLHGPGGKLIVDTFTQLAWDRFQNVLDDFGKQPLKWAINTHWHWDHTDNNARVRAAGATLIAHENTLQRMSEAHDLDVIGIHLDPSPPEALPQKTFRESYQMNFNGEHIALGRYAPAHTDSDIYVHFQKSNVLHMGDVFFNGTYCYIDKGTGGSIAGMIAGVNKMLAMVNADALIVPGHGPLGTKSDLRAYRDMLMAARWRVQKLKDSGKSLEKAIAAKPFTDLDPMWGGGAIKADAFVHLIYTTL